VFGGDDFILQTHQLLNVKYSLLLLQYGVNMGYIGYWKMDPTHFDTNIKKYQVLLEERKKGNTKYPLNPILDAYSFVGTYEGFVVYGDDTTQEQLENVSLHFGETMCWHFKPVAPASKKIELHMKK